MDGQIVGVRCTHICTAMNALNDQRIRSLTHFTIPIDYCYFGVNLKNTISQLSVIF